MIGIYIVAKLVAVFDCCFFLKTKNCHEAIRGDVVGGNKGFNSAQLHFVFSKGQNGFERFGHVAFSFEFIRLQAIKKLCALVLFGPRMVACPSNDLIVAF